MHKMAQPQSQYSTNYVLPEPSHIVLVQIRDHMRFLSRLVGDGVPSSGDAPPLDADALAWCFSRLAHDLDNVVEAIYWDAPAKAS